jgi:hypothetical protein
VEQNETEEGGRKQVRKSEEGRCKCKENNKNDYETHPASLPMSKGVSNPWDKVDSASIYRPGQQCVCFSSVSSTHIYGVVLKLRDNLVRFQVITTASTKMAVFWDVAPCSLLVVYRRFICTYCLHHQGDNNGDSKHL